MPLGHAKGCSLSPIIRGTQSEATQRRHFSPIILAKMWKFDSEMRLETGTLIHCYWESNTVQMLIGPSVQVAGCRRQREDFRWGVGTQGLQVSPPKMHATDKGKGITLQRGNLAAGGERELPQQWNGSKSCTTEKTPPKKRAPPLSSSCLRRAAGA